MTAILKLPCRVVFANSDNVRIDYKYINADKIIDFEEYQDIDGSNYRICIKYGVGKDSMNWFNTCITMDEFLKMLEKAGVPIALCSIDAELANFVQNNF